MEGGTALARVLYGQVNPSRKLPFAVPKGDCSSHYPYFAPYTLNITYGYYHGYTLFDKTNIDMAYTFGFGLSYTKFKIHNLKVLTPKIEVDDSDLHKTSIKVQIDITNVGDHDGTEMIQLYIGYANSQVDRPVKVLRDFQNVSSCNKNKKNKKRKIIIILRQPRRLC